MKLENKVILITSNEEWSETWFSKHNYAWELSKKNKVFFIDAVGRWHPRNIFTNRVEVEHYKGNLYILRYRNFIPALNSFFFRVNNMLVSRMIRKYLEKQGIHETILWAFDPYRLYNPARLNASVSVFHCADWYGFKSFGEKLLASKADHVFCMSREFVDTYKPFNSSIHIIPHGISSEEFSIEEELPEEKAPVRDYGLYVGNIDARIDYEMVERVVKEFPGTNFVFVGRVREEFLTEAGRRLFIEKKYSNLHALGPKHFKKLKHYIAPARFCIALMNRDHPGNNVSHHKTFQYLAFGKPVFCNRFSEYDSISSLLYMDNDKDRLVERMRNFITSGEDAALKEQRVSLARRHTFEEHFRKAEKIMFSKKSN